MIRVKGAREHNLQGIDVNIPKNKLVVITGLSGSGKSSLAFDTIYAEGQRRYVESLSAYARQFLNIQDKPDVESITGLSPAISINQKSISKNPRSTVGTVTEIYDYLRLIYARIGIPYSPATGLPITKQTVSQIVDTITALPLETKVYIIAPIVRGRKGEHLKEILEIKKQGYVRLKINGEICDIDDLPKLDKNKKHDIFVIADRVSISDDIGNRLPSSIESALRLAHGLMYAEIVNLPDNHNSEYKNGQTLTFSENFACPESGFTLEEIEPRLFSFNSPYGACSSCNGLGKKLSVDAKLIVPDETLSISEGALKPIGSIFLQVHTNYGLLKNAILSLAENCKFSLDVPWKNIDQKVKDLILFGSREMKFQGLVSILERQMDYDASLIDRYCSVTDCKECAGYRLRKEALTVKIDEKHIGEISGLSVDESLDWFENLPDKLTEQHKQISNKILNEIIKRLTFLKNVGLNYLTLDRESSTLSGGESQRIRLASQIGSGLTGVLYVLDEPSIGLHQCDNDRLIATLKNLRDMGNTVIVVEHDEDTIMAADYVIDIGPGAGVNGGKVVAEGTPDQLQKNSESITGQYLSADINVKDRSGSTPLHYATLSNHVEVVDALLAEGASVHVKDGNGSTPLHYAAKNGYLEIVDALLDRGADVYEKDSLQKTPLYYAIINHQEDTVESIKGFLKNKVVQGSVVVGGLVAMLGNFVTSTLFITETMEITLTSVMVAIAVSASTALTSGYAKYLMSKFDNEIKEIKERQDVMEGRQSLTEGWQNVGLQSIRIHNALL
ncbi:jg7807 [Pararge aegeria aegeria]|uniref:Jg7807 protein n=1 Tax=Pararge aegeria aegeria TaxID=348720 RepID=A0A8S4QM41_9NEOP|nr:jg7807 [Pararge aegeria aegeria]